MGGSISTSAALSLCADSSISRSNDILPSNSGSDAMIATANTANDASSILGSIASFDEVEYVNNVSPIKETNPRHGVMTINTVDVDVYERWEEVLTELGNNEIMNSYESSFES
jgi:hypothetical protein